MSPVYMLYEYILCAVDCRVLEVTRILVIYDKAYRIIKMDMSIVYVVCILCVSRVFTLMIYNVVNRYVSGICSKCVPESACGDKDSSDLWYSIWVCLLYQC